MWPVSRMQEIRVLNMQHSPFQLIDFKVCISLVQDSLLFIFVLIILFEY